MRFKFKTGDICEYISATAYNQPMKVEILHTSLNHHVPAYYVKNDNNNSFVAYEAELSPYQKSQGIAYNNGMVTPEMIRNLTGYNEWLGQPSEPRKCDCGAWKTYGKEIADVGGFHSTWCQMFVYETPKSDEQD